MTQVGWNMLVGILASNNGRGKDGVRWRQTSRHCEGGKEGEAWNESKYKACRHEPSLTRMRKYEPKG
jgi:hypothetical protein